jgi:hypothetical protein
MSSCDSILKLVMAPLRLIVRDRTSQQNGKTYNQKENTNTEQQSAIGDEEDGSEVYQ